MKGEFAIERYKYVLEQKRSLNDATFKIATFYQTAMVGLSIAQFKILEGRSSGNTEIYLVNYGSIGLLIIAIIVSFFTIVMLIGGVRAWMRYKKEEAFIETSAMGSVQSPAKLGNMLYWFETYIFLIVVLLSGLYVLCFFTLVSPRLEEASPARSHITMPCTNQPPRLLRPA